MSNDFAEAVASATAEVNGAGDSPAPATETAPAQEAPVAEITKTEETVKDDEEDEEPLVASAEDLKLINENPQLLKVYKSMQRGLTKKAQAMAEARKGFDTERTTHQERMQLLDWIQNDPDGALEHLAKIRGKTVAEIKRETGDPVVDSISQEWEKSMGKDATNLLRPLVEKVAKHIFDTNVAPLRQETQQLIQSARQSGLAAHTREFGAAVVERGEEWSDEIQAEMAALVPKLQPGEDVSLQEYLSEVYDSVMAKRARKAGLKRELKRLRETRETVEPTNAARPDPKAETQITSKMSEKDAIAAAVRMAKESLNVK